MMLFNSGHRDGDNLLFKAPITTLIGWVDASTPNSLKTSTGEHLDLRETLLALEQNARQQQLVMAGYLSYEAGQNLQSIATTKPRELRLPDVYIGLYHAYNSPAHYHTAHQNELNAARDKETTFNYFNVIEPFNKTQAKQQYLANISRILDHIDAGDCYQINYAQHFLARYKGSSFAAYAHLASTIDAPYSGYVNTGYGELIGLSPEQFIHVSADRRVVSKPIKGTAARQFDAQADSEAATQLQQSLKNRAENVMIVDLLRNDLGKVCETGSVQASALFELKSFTNVHHLVSTIEARLRADVSPLAALLSAFPGGSITGAPKIKSMHIIEALEPIRRSAYCGTQFYLSPDGELKSNILIRSLVADNGALHCWGGGGIVADSDPEQEYQETLDKVGIFLAALEAMP